MKGLNKAAGRVRKPEKDPSVGGSLVSPPAGGTINWQPPAYSPDTGLFYVAEHNGYLDLLSDRPRPARLDGPWREGGSPRRHPAAASSPRSTTRPGKPRGAIAYPSLGGGGGGGGLLTTAGGLVFGGDGGGNIVAYDAASGKPLWHARINGVSAPPQTYMLDGRQYLLVASGDTLYTFMLYLIGPARHTCVDFCCR